MVMSAVAEDVVVETVVTGRVDTGDGIWATQRQRRVVHQVVLLLTSVKVLGVVEATREPV